MLNSAKGQVSRGSLVKLKEIKNMKKKTCNLLILIFRSKQISMKLEILIEINTVNIFMGFFSIPFNALGYFKA